MSDPVTINMHYAVRAYYGSSGEVTKALYSHLETFGPAGALAVNLMRACKNSERAKVYRGGGNKGAAYDTKQWALANICRALTENDLDIKWGWRLDPKMIEDGDPHCQVLYIELPTGQVSFHTDFRCEGPDYEGEWDGVKGKGADRVLRFIGRLLRDAGADTMAIDAPPPPQRRARPVRRRGRKPAEPAPHDLFRAGCGNG